MRSAEDVARYFLCHADGSVADSISNMKLQKLVYYAQAWNLALLDKPLFQEEIEAWQHGPVVPDLYEMYKKWGADPIDRPMSCDLPFDPQEEAVLSTVKRIYGSMSATVLRRLSHQEDPWFHARGGLPEDAICHNRITHEAMKRFYRSLISDMAGQPA